MIAGIELGKKYAQVCVKTERMKEIESVTRIAGTEHYRIPVEIDISDQSQLQELFRKLWKMLSPYGTADSLEYLIFCLEENTEKLRNMLLDIVQVYHIKKEKIRFLNKEECFCAYVFHQEENLLTHQALLIENREGTLDKFLLQKQSGKYVCAAKVQEVSEQTLEMIFAENPISSVFLLGDDFEEEWMQQHKKLLKTGKRVFVGKNLFVKGACCRGIELKEKKSSYLYLTEGKVCSSIFLKTEKNGKELEIPIIEAGDYWYEAGATLEVLLMEDAELEFSIVSALKQEKKTTVICLESLPERPKGTTRLQIHLEFKDPNHVRLRIKDLGFGELFPQSDMVYEGELQWEL